MSHRVIFLGSPEFAVPCLDALGNDPRFDLVMVVSQPDRRAGRGRKMTPPPVAQWAIEHNIPLFQPESLRNPEAIHHLELQRSDLLIVVAYGEILNRKVLGLAPHGALNVHPSLLPKYRGAAPIPAAILNGDLETGVSIMKLVRKLDAGPVLDQTIVPMPEKSTTASLSDVLANVAAERLPDVADDWIAGSVPAVPQDEDLVTFTREWTKADVRINWTQPAAAIERLVRAATPWPVAWTTLGGSRVQIREAALSDVDNLAPGELASIAGRLFVGTGDGTLQLLTVQPESRAAMPADRWWQSVSASGASRFDVFPE